VCVSSGPVLFFKKTGRGALGRAGSAPINFEQLTLVCKRINFGTVVLSRINFGMVIRLFSKFRPRINFETFAD
jgi:hypothetical protein